MRITRIILLVIIVLFSLKSYSQELYVGTYNIRYNNNNDIKKGNGWEKRRKPLCDQINFEHPDIFGAQEVLHNQLTDMLDLLDNYDYIGCGRDDGKENGEYSPIFYDNKKFKPIDSGVFWFSETPDLPSKGWDAACNRICTWGLFEEKGSGHRFYFFNLHLDHVGVVARKESIKLVLNTINNMTGYYAYILTGDFNVDQRDEVYKTVIESRMLRDCYDSARIRFAENGTFNDYNQQLFTFSRIDHVFVSSHFTVDRYGLLTNTYWTTQGKSTNMVDFKKSERRLPSDHYPVFVHLKFKYNN